MNGVAVFGLGVGRQHALGYARMEDCAVRWVYDPNRKLAENVAVEVGAKVADTPAQVLEDAGVQTVSIASPDHLHADQVVDVLASGRHVFVEKPLCATRGDLRRIHCAWRSSGRHLRSNFVLRSAPLYRWLKAQIDAGALGRIFAIDGDYLYGRISKIVDGWRGCVDDYSVMLGGGVHMVDLMCWLAGERPTHVDAAGNRICTAGTAFRYNDYVAATFHFSSGLVGRVTANYGCVHGHQHVLRVFGERATFVLDDRGPRWQTFRDPAPAAESLPMASLPETKAALIPEFVAQTCRPAAHRADVYADFDVVSACLAADDSARTGTRVEIEYERR